MKKKLLLLICAVIIAGIAGGYFWYNSTYIHIDSEAYRRDIAEFTVTGDQMPETELLQQLPDLSILDIRNIKITGTEYEAL